MLCDDGNLRRSRNLVSFRSLQTGLKTISKKISMAGVNRIKKRFRHTETVLVEIVGIADPTRLAMGCH